MGEASLGGFGGQVRVGVKRSVIVHVDIVTQRETGSRDFRKFVKDLFCAG